MIILLSLSHDVAAVFMAWQIHCEPTAVLCRQVLELCLALVMFLYCFNKISIGPGTLLSLLFIDLVVKYAWGWIVPPLCDAL